MKENIVVIDNGEKVVLYNRIAGKTIRISKVVYDIIKDVTSVSDIEKIAEEYCDEDKEYFFALAKEMESCHFFEEYRKCDRLAKITFAVTDNCNLCCTHCCYSAKYNRDQVVIDMEILKRIIALDPAMLVITGGEPLIAKNIDEVMDYIEKEYKGICTLSTNATLITPQNVNRICQVFEQFDISLDGYDEESTDKIRGKGSFKKVVEAIKLLRKSTDKKIVISMAVDNDTYIYEDRFRKLCKDLGVEPMIRTMSMLGRAAKNHKDSDKIAGFMEGGINNIDCCYDCKGGIGELFVDDKGVLYPCSNFRAKEYAIGSIFDEDFQKKMCWSKDYEWFKNFSEYIPDTRNECMDCDIKTFCWNCPSLARAYIEYHNVKSLRDICKAKHDAIWEALWSE